jgi:hypothetical protein
MQFGQIVTTQILIGQRLRTKWRLERGNRKAISVDSSYHPIIMRIKKPLERVAYGP